MPKASELVALCTADQQAEIAGTTRLPGDAEAWVRQRNARLASDPNGRRGVEWFVDEAGETRLRSTR